MNASIIKLPKVEDDRGNLSFLESNNQTPFEIRRAYWIYDVPGGETRGSHAFRKTKEFIVALSGSFDVVLADGIEEKTFHLNRSYYGLFVDKMIWRSMSNFSTNALAMIVASTLYDPADYIRDFGQFQEAIRHA